MIEAVRSVPFWERDGDIVVRVQLTYFKLHGKELTRESPTILTNAMVSVGELVDGLAVIVLPGFTSEDFRLFLMMLVKEETLRT